MFIVYDFIFLIFAILYFPYLIIRCKWHPGFLMRFGFFSTALRNTIAGKHNLWIHAVSVGEVLSVLELVEQLKITFPHFRIVLSTVTKTGYELAKSRLENDALVIYAPLYFSISVRRVISLINPKMYVVTETELWPNLFYALSQKGVPIVVINGRVSDHAFRHYQKVRFLFKGILRRVRMFCMQTQLDAERIIALGAPHKCVQVVGNVKFDVVLPPQGTPPEGLGFEDSSIVWVAGSTHPGEEEILLKIFKSLSNDFHDLRLILAPRHVERVNEVVRLVEEWGFTPFVFSRKNEMKVNNNSIIIIDTIGHLYSLYRLAKLVFVGKSLIGRGGQNIIEPAAFGKPIFVGPYTENFRDIIETFRKENAIVQVNDETELLSKTRELLQKPSELHDIGKRARDVVLKFRGATQKTLEAIKKVLIEL